MADLRIVDAPEIPTENITGEEKLPTGGNGNYSISLDSLADYAKTKKDLADNNSVDNKVSGVRQQLNAHTQNLSNPHQVTKGQIGLGNVDNTADADKPVSNSTQAAIISAVSQKADKTYVDNALLTKSDKSYVDNQLTLKANKADVYTKQESNDLVNNSISTALTPVNTSLDLAKRGVLNRYDSSLTYNSGERVVLTNGDIVKNTVDGNTNDPNVDITGWVKTNSASQIVDGYKNQHQINNELKDKIFSFLDFGAKGDGITDDSIPIGLAATWSSIYKRKVSGVGRTYKCSNVFFDSNCHLADAKLINNRDEDLISVLTTTISSDWLENVVFEDIHINGARQDARTIKALVTSEDGGRHGFRFRRPCRNIWIIRSSANYCASDGVAIYPDYSGGLFESVQNFNVIDSEFLWNRRHGGSNDRTNGINFTNVKCKYNGLPLAGGSGYPATDGRNGDTFNGNYYGNGWDSEEYDDTTISQNMTFINCDMRGNAQSGLLIISTAGVVAPATPTNIKIIGGHYDKGVHNTDDDAAILITPNSTSNLNDIYTNTVIDSVSTSDGVTLRNNVNFSVTNTPCTLAVLDRCSGYIDAKVTSYDIAPGSAVKFLDGTPVGAINYNRDTGVKTITEYPITDNMFNDAQSKYHDYRVGTFKFGQIETKVDSSINAVTWTWKTGADVERFRVGRYGAQLHVPDAVPDAELKNQGLVFELVSNTQLRIKVKGSDGVVRSSTLTLA